MFPRLVAGVEPQLLHRRQAVDRLVLDRALDEGVRRIAERLKAFEVRLPTDAVRVKDDRMEIDLAGAGCDQGHTTRSPVRLDCEAVPIQRQDQVIERQLGYVDRKVEVAMPPGLAPHQCIDTPPTGNPDALKSR